MSKILKYTGDFETTTKLEDCRVWSWGTCEIGNIDNIYLGTTIDEFFDWCQQQGSVDLYFHNERFDGEFMLSWLFNNGFEWKKEATEPMTFSTLISGMGQWYALEICWGVTEVQTAKMKRPRRQKQRTIVYDSLKKYPFPVARIAKAFDFPMKKGEIDYTKDRPVGYQPTEDEWQYQIDDIKIMSMALDIQFKQGLTKMTRGSDALSDYKDWVDITFGKSTFKQWFPVMTLGFDKNLRGAYKGGFTWVNRKFQGKLIGEGIVFDVNSLYPAMMYNKPMPYGMPVLYRGEYKENDEYPIYIQHLKVRFRIKPDHIPTIQIKKSGVFAQNEYLESTVNKLGVDECVELALTSVDMELLFAHYDILEIHYEYGYMFRATTEMFKGWIDKWTEVKTTTDGAKRDNAKGILNSLYGKFGTNPDITGKKPVFDKETGIVKLVAGVQETRDPVYVPLAAFVTAWGRWTTITTAQACYDRIIYCDTDSIHLTGTEIPESIAHIIHDKKLGYWGHESTFQRGLFLRQKTYVEEVDGVLHVRCAGMPEIVRTQDPEEQNRINAKRAAKGEPLLNFVSLDNFKVGFTTHGKLLPKRTQGGIVLTDTMFSIK